MTPATPKATYPEAWLISSTAEVGAAGWAIGLIDALGQGLADNGFKTQTLADKSNNPNPVEARQAQVAMGNAINQKIQSGDPFFLVSLNLRLDFTQYPPEFQPQQFSWVGDNPIHHVSRLNRMGDKVIVGMPDRRFQFTYETLGYTDNLLFFPHAGPLPSHNPAPMADRENDFVFAANLQMMPGSEKWHAHAAGLAAPLRDCVDDAVDNVLSHDKESFQALVETLAHQGRNWQEFDIQDIQHAFKVVETYSESLRRWTILQAFDKLGVHIIGDVDADAARHLSAFATFHPYRSFDQMLDLIRRSKVLINSTPKFADGAHDRIWNGMANGCVVATTHSAYMAETFHHDRDIVYFPRDVNGFDAYLGELAAAPQRLEDMTVSADSLYTAAHTWQQRVKLIEQVLIE